jgi:hypothetical protein
MRTRRGETVVVGLGRTEREFSERDREVVDTPSVGWPSTSGRPNILAGCPARSPRGSRCRRARRS